jgi:hypothetical protein
VNDLEETNERKIRTIGDHDNNYHICDAMRTVSSSLLEIFREVWEDQIELGFMSLSLSSRTNVRFSYITQKVDSEIVNVQS